MKIHNEFVVNFFVSLHILKKRGKVVILGKKEAVNENNFRKNSSFTFGHCSYKEKRRGFKFLGEN